MCAYMCKCICAFYVYISISLERKRGTHMQLELEFVYPDKDMYQLGCTAEWTANIHNVAELWMIVKIFESQQRGQWPHPVLFKVNHSFAEEPPVPFWWPSTTVFLKKIRFFEPSVASIGKRQLVQPSHHPLEPRLWFQWSGHDSGDKRVLATWGHWHKPTIWRW